jgi:hypothetical protein
MLKVFGFVRRHPNLTHDEYRAGHVGYHNSFGRRLNGIRGYLLNVRANAPIEETLGAQLLGRISKDEPAGFDDLWDGWGQLLFDSLDVYLAARSPARDMAGPDGLQMDPGVAGVGGDFEYLYGGSPFQFHVAENVVVPVVRPERKLFKLVQFVQRPDGLEPELFRAYLSGRYARMIATFPGLCGLVANFRTEVDVMTHFFAPDSEGFTPEGTALRERFFSSWDAMMEYWLESPADFVAGRTASDVSGDMAELENTLMNRSFYREVDETVAVLPNRAPPPPFYHR